MAAARCICAFLALGLVRPAAAPAQMLVDPPELVGAVATPGDAFDVIVIDHYVLVPDYDFGLQVIDVADPAAPTIVGAYDTPGFAVHGSHTGDIVFVADHRVGGVRIIDVSTKTSPHFLASHVTGGTALMASWQGSLLAVGYIEGTLELVDVSAPSHPVSLGTYDTPGAPRHAAFDGDLLYVADNTFGLLVLNIGDPTAPFLVGSAAANRPIGLDRVGDRLYLADLDGLSLFDVATPAAPALLETAALPGPAVKVHVTGGYAFVADHVAGGLQVVDVSDGLDVVSGYVTGNYAHGVAVSGEYAYLADGVGLKVFRVFAEPVPTRRSTLGGLKARFQHNGQE